MGLELLMFAGQNVLHENRTSIMQPPLESRRLIGEHIVIHLYIRKLVVEFSGYCVNSQKNLCLNLRTEE